MENASVHWKRCWIGPETNPDTRIVLDLAEDIDNSCRNITCDNFFTNLLLVRKLLHKNLTLIETMRKSKPKLPMEFAVAKTECEEQSLRFSTRCNDCIVLS